MADIAVVDFANEVKLFNKWSFDDVEPTGLFIYFPFVIICLIVIV